MSEQYKAALIRALYGGLVLAGVAVFADLGMDGTWQSAGIKAGAAFFGYLMVRGGFEGEYDTHRNRRGIVLPGDVSEDHLPPGYSGKHAP